MVEEISFLNISFVNATLFEEEQTVFKYIVEGVLLTAVSTLGISANTLSIAVLSRSEMRSHFSQMLQVLAGFDILYLISSMLIFGLPELFSYYRLQIYPLIVPFVFGVCHIGRVGSVFLTLSITIERFVAVTRPLYSEQQTLKRILLSSSSTFSVLYNIPRFWELTYKQIEIEEENGSTFTAYMTTFSKMRASNYYMNIHFWSKIVLVEIGPYILLATLNIIIILRTRQSSHLQPRSAHASKKEIQMVHILLLIVIMFIICQSFKVIPDLYEVAQCSFGGRKIPQCWENPPEVVSNLATLSHLALSVNSSANFFVYVAWGSKFRAALMRLLRSRYLSGWLTSETNQNFNMRVIASNAVNVEPDGNSTEHVLRRSTDDITQYTWRRDGQTRLTSASQTTIM